MKINRTDQVGAVNSYKKAHESASPANLQKKKQKDQVEISAEAKELLNGTQGVTETSGSKLEELKASVQTGTYHVDARKLAEKIFPFLK
ncbi:flagellar biosynthesis anti-sigma factor FlgM [Paenibacillus puerhi]|uniref:flagellar biosynthesis anti-sigma factor FlgM n=1 Tax=Paenibacillus puerhi TaxID=2692622 RepID=UPI00135B567E|nr:flagellar biosynthesis anti-sigma factor FlgM [Paenibacillus puerhi]